MKSPSLVAGGYTFSWEMRTRMLALQECGHPRSILEGYRCTKELLVGLSLPFFTSVPVKVLRYSPARRHFQDSNLSCQVD